MHPSRANKILDALVALTQRNVADFCKSPILRRKYLENLSAGNHIYVSDYLTCGWPDCWSTYQDLVKRYPKGPVLLDCEDAAAAHIGWLFSECKKGLYIGLCPGKAISHAIGGVDRKTPDVDQSKTGKNVYIVDPALWFGMPTMVYKSVFWRKIA